jgi:hypothetical protein
MKSKNICRKACAAALMPHHAGDPDGDALMFAWHLDNNGSSETQRS